MSRLIPGLPDEISILCIARVHPSHHRSLSAVSRAWRSLVRSPLLFSTRIEVGVSQPYLFVSFSGVSFPNNFLPWPNNSVLRWYLLDPSFDRPYTPLPAQPHPSIYDSTAVSLGHSLYLLGGYVGYNPSSIVQIYDAQFDNWRRGPDMFASRTRCAAGVISGRIYVVGGCDYEHDVFVEAFDPENARWRPVPFPEAIRPTLNSMNHAVTIGDKLMWSNGWDFVVFDPAEATEDQMWRRIMVLTWSSGLAVVDEILCSYSVGMNSIRAFDFTSNNWSAMEGQPCQQLFRDFHHGKMVNFGQMLCFIRENSMHEDEQGSMICCGAFRVFKTNTGSLSYSFRWFKRFFFPSFYDHRIRHFITLEF